MIWLQELLWVFDRNCNFIKGLHLKQIQKFYLYKGSTNKATIAEARINFFVTRIDMRNRFKNGCCKISVAQPDAL